MMDREWGKPCMIKSINKTSTINRRKFDETFKREAVNNWISSGKAAAVIAQELKVPLGTVLSRMRAAMMKLEKSLGQDFGE